MNVGWLMDASPYVGGAELTQAEFRDAAPDDITVVDCPAGNVRPGLDRYVIHNCVTYGLEDLASVDAPAVKYWHDVGPHVPCEVREWLARHAQEVCCSPLQQQEMRLDGAVVPPAMDLSRFEAAAGGGERSGSVSVAAWQNPGKAPEQAAKWGADNGGVQFFGGGPFAPPGSVEVPQEDMPALLASFERFVFLPTALEPFGRVVVEAWAAGCEIVTNRLVGARYWIEENPDAMETAAEDFWKLVTA